MKAVLKCARRVIGHLRYPEQFSGLLESLDEVSVVIESVPTGVPFELTDFRLEEQVTEWKNKFKQLGPGAKPPPS